MGLFRKKEIKEKEQQYGLSPTQIRTTNYKVYYLTPIEKTLYFLLAFGVGATVGYLFYGGIGTDEYGNPTTITHILNIAIPAITGFIAGRLFLPIREKQIVEKRKKQLARQFRDMLDGIATAIGAGSNTMNAFTSVYDDLKLQYDDSAFILTELEIIISGMHSNFALEDLLEDFGKRSGNDDIMSFANVFKICFRKGGNIKETIRSTHEILSRKMEIVEDIETTVSGSKLDQMIMVVMPIALVGIIKVMSPDFANNFVSGSGLIATTIAIILFVASYYLGKKIMDIKI